MGRDTDFEYGANELQGSIADDLPTCMAGVYCPDCSTFHGYCNETRALRNEAKRQGFEFYRESNSIQEAQPQMDLSSQYDKGAKKGGAGGKFKRKPFLKSSDIPVKGTTAKITDVREAPKQMEYSDLLVDLTIGKKEFTWGLKFKSVTLNMIIDELGKRTEKWVGKSVKLIRGGAKGQYVNIG